MNAALRLIDLTVSYDRHPAVHHVSAEIPAAEMTAIVGPNGAGKSTLLKALLGLAPHIEGRIECSAKRIAYLPQQAEIDRCFPISVFDTVLLGRWSRFGGFGAARPRRPARCPACHRGGRARGLRAPADRHAVGRPVPARAVRAPAAAGRRSRPARRAVRRHRQQDRGRPDGRDPALARREAHRRRGAARSRPGAPRLPAMRCCWRASWSMPARPRACCRPRTCCGPAPWPRPGTSMPTPAKCRCG